MANGFHYNPFAHVVSGAHQEPFTPPPFRMYNWRPELGGVGAADPSSGAGVTAATAVFFVGAAALAWWAYSGNRGRAR